MGKDSNMTKSVLLAAAALTMAAPAMAAPINGTGDVTPDIIFGSGNANGGFTGINNGVVELGLRGKLRYDASGQPQNIFNYDGVNSYFFTNIGNAVPANRSVFNFEFSINSDPTGQNGTGLNTYTYTLSVDTDPGAGTSFLTFDPCVFDNAVGTNTTANGDGTTSFTCGDGSQNVAQNSQNLGFGYTANPQAPGQYTFMLEAFEGGASIGSTLINVYVDTQPVPAPAALGLLGLGLAGMGALRRRRAA